MLPLEDDGLRPPRKLLSIQFKHPFTQNNNIIKPCGIPLTEIQNAIKLYYERFNTNNIELDTQTSGNGSKKNMIHPESKEFDLSSIFSSYIKTNLVKNAPPEYPKFSFSYLSLLPDWWIQSHFPKINNINKIHERKNSLFSQTNLDIYTYRPPKTLRIINPLIDSNDLESLARDRKDKNKNVFIMKSSKKDNTNLVFIHLEVGHNDMLDIERLEKY